MRVFTKEELGEELYNRVQKEKEKLPDALKNHPYGFLLQRYFEHKAQDFTIKEKYPWVVLDPK